MTVNERIETQEIFIKLCGRTEEKEELVLHPRGAPISKQEKD